MESLPKGWQSVRHGLYANDNMGGVLGRAGARPPCQCELLYKRGSLLRAMGGRRVITSLCIQQTAKS